MSGSAREDEIAREEEGEKEEGSSCKKKKNLKAGPGASALRKPGLARPLNATIRPPANQWSPARPPLLDRCIRDAAGKENTFSSFDIT